MQTAATKQTLKGAVEGIVAQNGACCHVVRLIPGIRGLYTGLSASIFRQMTYSLTRLGVYDVIKDKLSNNGQKKLSLAEMTFCASVAGALGGVAGNPADVVLVRMVADPSKPPAQQVHYRNAVHGVWRMIQTGGVASLFRGLAPNTVSLLTAQLTTVPRCHHELCPARLVRRLQGPPCQQPGNEGWPSRPPECLCHRWNNSDDYRCPSGRDQEPCHVLAHRGGTY